MLYCIGDSHVNLFTEYLEYWWIPVFGPYQITGEMKEGYLSTSKRFTTFRIGPCTAYNLCKLNSTTESRRRLNQALELIPLGSNILFSFGWVDCKWHIWKHLDPNTLNLKDAVMKCVDRYMFVLNQIEKRGYHCYIWNIVPPIGEEDINDRVVTTLAFNRDLSCQKFPFLSIYNQVCKEDNTGNLDYIDAQGHLNQRALPFAVSLLRERNLL